MATARKIEANRRNAGRSTGPRSSTGKARTRRNAFKHGLAVCSGHDPSLSAEVESLAKAFACGRADDIYIGAARVAAEATLDLKRIRSYKVELINLELAKARTENSENANKAAVASFTASFHLKTEAFIRALPLILKIDRYERRALSRRKRALRLLDHE